MVLVYLALKARVSVAETGSPGTRCRPTSNDFQTWLVDQRNAESPSIVIRAFNGFANFLDDLVTWFTNVPGLADLDRRHRRRRARLAPLRRRARAAIWALAAFAAFAAQRALAREHADAGAHARRGRASRSSSGCRSASAAGLSDRFQRGHHPRARRDADHAGVRLPDADRDPLLGRAGRRGDHDDDLRDPAGDPDHRARDPRRAREHRRGGRGDGLDAAAGALQGAAAARAADAAALRQPDDPLRALDGRDRGPDRGQGPRRRRHERAQLVSGARAARRAS